MNDKIKLLELANKKVEGDGDFIAYFLSRYAEIEKLSQQDMMSALKCSIENYYKLGLCKAPNANSSDFIDELNKVSNYTNISTLELNKIIKRVSTIEKFSQLNNNPILMAARDKKKKKDSEGE